MAQSKGVLQFRSFAMMESRRKDAQQCGGEGVYILNLRKASSSVTKPSLSSASLSKPMTNAAPRPAPAGNAMLFAPAPRPPDLDRDEEPPAPAEEDAAPKSALSKLIVVSDPMVPTSYNLLAVSYSSISFWASSRKGYQQGHVSPAQKEEEGEG